MINLRFCCMGLLALVVAISSTAAASAVLALAPTNTGANLHVVDVTTRNATVLEASSCCAVQVGTVAADIGNDRVFYLATDAGIAKLYTFGYGVTASLNSIAISAGRRVTHLNYDVLRSRLVGFVAEDDGSIDVATVNPSSGGVVVTGALGPSCCTLHSGISAYNAGTDVLYAIGRRSTDSNDQLLVFGVSSGALLAARDLGNEHVVQLVVDGNALYALSSNSSNDLLRPALISFAPAFAVNPIGAGTSDCCFVLAGSSTIDHAHNAMVALTRSSSTNGMFQIRAFSLADGSVSVGNSIPAIGLFEDSIVLFDRIFANDFE